MKKRNWPLTVLAFAAAAFTGWATYICWVNLTHDAYMWAAIVALALSSILFLTAAISGKAYYFFVALISWW